MRLVTLALRFIYPLVKFYWFIFRPEGYGVKCVIRDDSEILFVRHTYGKKFWNFPGGAIRKNENPEEAAKREIREELGIEIDNVEKIGEFIDTSNYKRDNIICFSGRAITKNFQINKLEILEAGWYKPPTIPKPLSKIAQRILVMAK